MRKAKPPHDAYPVRTVAQLTGLSADVIRAWEKRYSVVAPVRGPRGARLYSAADVAHLRLLARAVGSGRAIGDVARLERATLEALTTKTHSAARVGGDQTMVGPLLDVVASGDAHALHHRLGEALVALGARRFVRELAAPLLTKVGERWSTGDLTIAGEHLVSAAIRGLLSGLIRFRANGATAPTVLLATPSGERHELGLLLVALLAVDAGLGLHYVGTDLPASEIAAAARRTEVAVVGLGLVNSGNDTSVAEQIRAVERALPHRTELWLGGRNAAAVARKLPPTRAMVLDELTRVESELARVRTVHDRTP